MCIRDSHYTVQLTILIKMMNEDGTNEILPKEYKLFILSATILPCNSYVERTFLVLRESKILKEQHDLRLPSAPFL